MPEVAPLNGAYYRHHVINEGDLQRVNRFVLIER
jgi:hypothetical protein